MKRLRCCTDFKRLFAVWGLLCLTWAAAQGPPAFQRLQVVTAPTGTTLTVYASAPFAETAYRPSPKLLLVDLHNVRLGEDRPLVTLPRGPVTSYRLYTYRGANNEEVLRVEVGLQGQVQPNVQVAGNKLIIQIGGSGSMANSQSTSATAPALATAASPAPVTAPRPSTHPSTPSPSTASQWTVVHHAPARPAPAPRAPVRVASASRHATPHAITHAAPISGAPAFTGIEVSSSARGVVLLLRASRPIETWKSFPLHGPERLVIDLPGLTRILSRTHWAVGKDNLKDVRVGQFSPSVVRVVLDLGHALKPVIGKTPQGLRVVIPAAPNAISSARPGLPAAHPHTSQPARVATAHPAVAAPRPITPVRSVRAASTPARPGLKLTGFEVTPAPPAVHHPPLRRARLTPVPPAAPVSRPAVAAASRGDPPSSFHPVVSHPAAPAPKAPAFLPVSAPTPSPAQSTPSQSNAIAPHTPRGQAPQSLSLPLDAQVAAGAGSVPYTGQRISLNLKDADIKDFFRLIHEISGLNLVIDPNVKGTVTMVLNDVPWDQALDLVLRNNQLGRELEGNVVRIATLKTLQTEAAEQTQLNRAQEDAVPLVTEVKSLSYAKATSLVDPLKQFIGKRGDLTPDARTNTLIIQTTPDKLPLLNRLIARLDQKTPQVEVEARVVAASRNFSRELGVQLGFGLGNSTTALGGNPNVGSSPTTVSGLSPNYPVNSGSIPLVSNLPVGAPTSGLGFISATNSYRIDAVLSAAEQRGLGHVLSRPKVITQNNAQATVQQGVKIPVQTTINNTISVQFFNVTLRLSVTPQITADNTVFLQVDIENDQIDPGIPRIQGVPAIDTQQTTTNVLVQNGATVVVGGVMINNSQNNVQQVPLLGSLPVVGNLFKHTSIQNNSQELLFFLTPRILQS